MAGFGSSLTSIVSPPRSVAKRLFGAAFFLGWSSPVERASGMPVFYFNIRGAGVFVGDDEGGEFSDLGAAKREVRECARDILIQRAIAGERTVGQIEIADGTGSVLETIPLDELRKSVMH